MHGVNMTTCHYRQRVFGLKRGFIAGTELNIFVLVALARVLATAL